MARRGKFRNYRRRGRNFIRRHKPKPALIDLMGFGVPQLLAMSGAPGVGYNAIDPLLAGDWNGAIRHATANEVLLWTGYDMIGGGWNPIRTSTILNYGLTFGLPYVLKKIFKRKVVNIPMIGNVRIL